MSTLDGIAPEVTAALEDIRKDASSTRWVLIGFESPDNTKLVLLGSGSGTVEETAEKVPASDMAYGVVRRSFVMDETGGGMGKTTTLKFIRLTWRPESKLSMKRKMKVGTLDAPIKKLLGATHADYEVDDTKDLNDAAIVDLIERITQKVDNVHSAEGKAASTFYNSGMAVQARTAKSDKDAAYRAHDAYLDKSSLTGQAKGAEVEFQNPDEIKEAIARLRDDNDNTVNWVLTGYLDKKTIGLVGTGAGDVSEMLDACRSGVVMYGLFRVTEQIDKTVAVKFCFLTWQPEDVPVMMKAAISTHRGAVLPMFRPYHVDFTASAPGELSHASVMEHIMSLSGTKSKVTDAKPAAKQEQYERKMLGGVKVEEVKLEVVDREALAGAIKNVRNDADSTNWVTASVRKDDLKLELRGSGSGGVGEFAACLCADNTTMSYGLMRLSCVVDRSTVVKFCFVTYQGEKMAPTLKARLSSMRGGVVAVFHPYHAEYFIDSPGECTEASLRARLG